MSGQPSAGTGRGLRWCRLGPGDRRRRVLLKSRLTVTPAAAMLAVAGLVPAHAAPGPNGNNTYGLCTAYFNGSDQGQAQKQANGAAFVALAGEATAWDAQNDQNEQTDPNEQNESTNDKVHEYCDANGQHP